MEDVKDVKASDYHNILKATFEAGAPRVTYIEMLDFEATLN